MPSNKPKTSTADRPSPKARAASLKAAAPEKLSAKDGSATDLHMMAGAIIHDDGTAHFCDAASRVLRKPVADWIAFMAMRLSVQARKEMARQLNDPTLTDDARAGLSLELRRGLRIDALHILTGYADAAFKTAIASESDLPEIPARPCAAAGRVSPELIRATDAHREAAQLAIHDPIAGKARDTATARRVRALADAIRDTPARTPADLRHKVIYLWPGALDEYVSVGELADTLHSFRDDAERLGREPSSSDDTQPGAIDFTPWDRTGPCPVPNRAQWIEAADEGLPWLRTAFLFMCMSKAELGKNLCEMSAEDFEPIFGAIKHQEVVFRQIADMATASLARGIVAMEAHLAAQKAAAETAARG